MITCNKCKVGKVIVDLTLNTGYDYEVYCILCGKRDYIGFNHPFYLVVREFVSNGVA